MKTNELLKNKKIKITKARVIIYDLLLKSEDSLTADYIHKKCNELETINLSTVYRNLELFEKENLIEKVFASDGTGSYKIKKNNHNHVVECDMCHKEIEVECPMTQIEEMLKVQTGFKLTEHKLQLKGVCSQCNDK